MANLKIQFYYKGLPSRGNSDFFIDNFCVFHIEFIFKTTALIESRALNELNTVVREDHS